jgi:hypothetical protein
MMCTGDSKKSQKYVSLCAETALYCCCIKKTTNVFKRGYQPRSNLVKDENGGLLADSHNILYRWKRYFSHSWSVNKASDVRWIEIHSAGPIVPGPRRLEVEIALTELKKYNSSSSDQITAAMIQAGS